MAFCANCGASFADGAVACPQCGTPVAAYAAPGQQAQQYQQPQYQQPQYQQYQQPQYAPVAPVPVNTRDHSADFDAEDISANKIIAMACYLFSVLGIIISLLAAKDSKYAAFHARNALKLEISMILLPVLCIVPFLGWIAAGIGAGVLLVVKIICFFNVCNGKAKDAWLFGTLPFFN
ncbi:MAG: zinc-ribbon domain-containing protein [Lachnospiraceae bacterium]|nr:zinc-ribbon domain-containing protein [Lachnospiraceae bacterium]